MDVDRYIDRSDVFILLCWVYYIMYGGSKKETDKTESK